jgi:hypothetical protein
MTVKTFTIGCAKTINLGNFQSLRIEASVTIEEWESWDQARADAQMELRRLLEETYQAQYKKTEGRP